MAYGISEFQRADDGAAARETPLPTLDYIWNWFCQLTRRREQGWGCGPISHREIKAWATLYRVDPSPSEVAALVRLDDAFLQYCHDKDNPAPAPPSQVLADAAFIAKAERDALKPRNKRS